VVATEKMVQYGDVFTQHLAQPGKHLAIFVLAGTPIRVKVDMCQGLSFAMEDLHESHDLML
jgi:hypothetical protein